MSAYFTVGKAVSRVDALEKVTGKAVFGDDMKFSNLLYGKTLRSPCAHAKIKSIDASKAQRLSGVKAIVTAKDIPPFLGGEALNDYPFLATDKVRFIGEAVAAVAAVDEDTAEEALDLIKVEYEELPATLDPIEAMKPGTAIIHEKLHTYEHIPIVKPVRDSNICHHVQFIKGEIKKGFAESDFIFEDTFTTQMTQHAAIEPHMAVAQIDPTGRVIVWVPNDAPHRLRKDLARAMKIPLTKMRIISPPYLGAGFGGKGGLKVETLCIALALKTNGRPVKIVLTREEVFTSSLVRHPTVTYLKTGIKKNGIIHAREARVIYDTGAYAEKGPTVCQQGAIAALGPYKIPHAAVDGYCVYTNKPIAGAYRGYGHFQIAWAHESQMDIIAHEIGIDPVKIRRMNVIQEGDTSPTGRQVFATGVGLKQCIEKAAQAVNWNKGKEKNRGKGIACGYKATKVPSGSSAIVKVSEDGSVEVLSSTVEIGQGAKTILSQMVAEELGVSMEMITIPSPDTDVTPYDASTTGSRSTFHMGNAVRRAAQDARQQLYEIASRFLGVEIADLRAKNGIIYAKNNHRLRKTFAEVIKDEYGGGLDIIGRGSYYSQIEGHTGGLWTNTDPSISEKWSSPSIWMFGSDAAQVEVDVDTGKVKVLKITGAYNVGKVINPLTCEGQIEGGLVHGMGHALFEEMLTGKAGELLNPSFADYKIPTSLDIQELVPIIVEEPQKEGPWGAKGIGEMTLVSSPAAIANAIYDAIGIRIKDLPVTPEKILEALKEKQATKKRDPNSPDSNKPGKEVKTHFNENPRDN